MTILFCPGFVYVTYYRIFLSETKGPHHIHSLNSIQRCRKPCYGHAVHVPKQFLVICAKIQDIPASDIVRSHSRCILSFDLISQGQNERFYVTEIVLLLRFADIIFRRERSDNRKYVCCLQASLKEERKMSRFF